MLQNTRIKAFTTFVIKGKRMGGKLPRTTQIRVNLGPEVEHQSLVMFDNFFYLKFFSRTCNIYEAVDQGRDHPYSSLPHPLAKIQAFAIMHLSLRPCICNRSVFDYYWFRIYSPQRISH